MYDQIEGKMYNTDAHQLEAYEHLESNPRAALFLGMSLSKTAIALSYLHDMHYREVAFLKTIVIAPDKVARVTWPDELAKWRHLNGTRMSVVAGTEKQRLKALEVEAEIYVIGVDNVTWLVDQYITQAVSKVTGIAYGPWRGKWPFDSCLIDEASLFKGRDSQRFKKLDRALEKSGTEYRIGMTGTPNPNGLVDLWAIFKLIDGGARLGKTFKEFESEYFTTRGNGMVTYEWMPKPHTKKMIPYKIRDIALSMQTRDLLKLPDMHIVDEWLTFEPFDMETYEELEREYVLEFDAEGDEAVTVKTPADLSNKLLQISSGAVYADREEGTGPKVWHELNTLKLDALGRLLDDYPDETFILVYQFRHEVERITARFPFARQLRKGKATADDVHAWNRKEIRLLIIHPAGAGHGLNLQFGGRRMVWFSPTWNLEHWLQTVARLLRRGALLDIYIHRLLVHGTRDESVRKRIHTKDTNQTFLLNELKELRQKHGSTRQKLW